jgi:hydroxymethylbilane synthase
MSGAPLRRIVLGTRGSELALAQVDLVKEALRGAWPELQMEVRMIKTRGDQTEAPPSDRKAGRKGMFTTEIEQALQSGEINLAVHSAKDLPSEMNATLEIVAALPRAPVQDVLVTKVRADSVLLPTGALVATGSVRRQHQLRWRRPDLQVVDLRGNVPTRLRKLQANDWSGIILARAGLERLGFNPVHEIFEFEGSIFFSQLLSIDEFLPAGGQGIIALQAHRADPATKRLLEKINNTETLVCLQTEREFLRLLQGDCDSPVGVHCTIKEESIQLRAQIFEAERAAPAAGAVSGREPERLPATLLKKIHGG